MNHVQETLHQLERVLANAGGLPNASGMKPFPRQMVAIDIGFHDGDNSHSTDEYLFELRSDAAAELLEEEILEAAKAVNPSAFLETEYYSDDVPLPRLDEL